MKTHTIKTPTAELMVVELPENAEISALGNGHEVHYASKHNSEERYTKIADGKQWKLLGKPDEISEEDARELVELPIDKWGDDKFRFLDYRYDGHYDLFTATESLLSLIESEIYWENPIKHPKDYPLAPQSLNWYANQEKKFIQAEQKTFDKNRSLIFKKNQ